MDPRLVVIPDPDQGDVARVREVHGDRVGPARREGGQPDVHVVLRPVHPVDEVGDHTGVPPVSGQDIDVRRVGLDVRSSHWFSPGAEDFYPVKAHVVLVPPGGLDVHDQVLSVGQDGDFKVAPIVRVGGAVVLPWDRLRLLFLQEWRLVAAPAALLLLQEVVQDVALELRGGDASPVGAVEGAEGVPGLMQRELLLTAAAGWRPGGPGTVWKKGHGMGKAPLVARVEVGTLRHCLI